MYAFLLILLLFYLWYTCKNPSVAVASTVSAVVGAAKVVTDTASSTASAAVNKVSSFLNGRG